MITEDEKNDKKELLARIRAQMEFYFSEANLSKDRFLKQEMKSSEEGYVRLEVFLKFNKIRQLTLNQDLIAKSLKKSVLLDLNDDKTMVKRKVQFIEPTQKTTDKKTIYVENLPGKVTNDLLKKHFESKFGKVCYISMPKYKTSHQLKGFAFVEFEEVECAKKAYKLYKSDENTERIIGKFPKSHKIITDLEKKISKVQESIDHYESKNPSGEFGFDQKRKLVDSDLNVAKKKIKKEEECTNKKPSLETLHVISKKKWLKLREEFLDKQKTEISELKNKLDSLNAQLNARLNEKYKAQNANLKTDDIVKCCVIKLTLNPSDAEFDAVFKLSRQEFKNKFLKEESDHVAYVDVERNNSKVLIRCNTPESAKALIKSPSLSQFGKFMLEGCEELEYFEKIFFNRTKKLNKKEKKKESGLIKEAAQSIKSEVQDEQDEQDQGSRSQSMCTQRADTTHKDTSKAAAAAAAHTVFGD